MTDTTIQPRAAHAGTVPGYAAVLARADGKARVDLQRHADALDALRAGGRATTWRELVALLGGLADHAIKTIGPDAVQFFVADGRYRLQLFALEDRGTGHVEVFLPDVLDQAVARGLVEPAPGRDGHYAAAGDPTAVLAVELLDGATATVPAAHYKFMVGLSRRAIRLSLAAAGDPGQMRIARGLCELAASLNVPATSRPRFPEPPGGPTA